MTSQARVIRLEPLGPAGAGLKQMQLQSEDFQSPLPKQNVHVFYSDETLGLAVGVWDTTTMQEAFGPYPGDEFIWVLEGRFSLMDGTGGSVDVVQGDCAAIRNAIPVSWKQQGYLKKFYITYLDPNAAVPKLESAENGVIILDPEVVSKVTENPKSFVFAGERPVQRDNAVFSNDAGNMFAGTWDSTAMQTQMRPFPWHEFVRVLEGRISISEADGAAQVFQAGDCFFVPKGTVCSWKIDSYAKTHYATLNAG